MRKHGATIRGGTGPAAQSFQSTATRLTADRVCRQIRNLTQDGIHIMEYLPALKQMRSACATLA